MRSIIMAPEVDVTMLIQEIQNRPAIYDTSKAEYHDRHLKRKMWEEVCCNVYSAPVWTCLTSKEKTKYGKFKFLLDFLVVIGDKTCKTIKKTIR